MLSDERLLTRASEICASINALSAFLEGRDVPQQRIVLSFDVFCVLLEYTAHLRTSLHYSACDVEELLGADDLVFETARRDLPVRIDFFLPANTFDIE